jgi:ATP-dependent HslUV protease ATP-binding subunit HslU
MVQDERREEVRDAADAAAVERIVDLLYPETRAPGAAQAVNAFAQTLGSIFGNSFAQGPAASPLPRPRPPANARGRGNEERIREQARADVLRGFFDVRLVDIEVEEAQQLPIGDAGRGRDARCGGADMSEMLGGLMPKKKTRKRVTVAEARRIFAQEEAQKLVDMDAVGAKRCDARRERHHLHRRDRQGRGARRPRSVDVSREGVQRDILPIVEGSTVSTKHGAIKTDHVLFIAAGAFHMSKPSDLIPELQGRFPIRVSSTHFRSPISKRSSRSRATR